MTDETIADLADLVARHPLPDGVPDAVLNKGEVADFFGVSLPTVDAWIRDGMPVSSKGTNGQAWEFRAGHCWAWRQAREDDQRTRSKEAQAAIAAMRLQLVGGEAGDSIRALPPRERRDIYEVEAAHRRLMEVSNRLIDRDQVRDEIEQMLSLVRDAVTSLSDRMEREAGLTGAAIETVDTITADMLVTLHNRLAEFFDARPVSDRASDADLFTQ